MFMRWGAPRVPRGSSGSSETATTPRNSEEPGNSEEPLLGRVRAVALLVLLPRPAGAGIVAADFRLGAFHGGRGFFRRAGEGQLLLRRLRRQGALHALRFLAVALACQLD